MGRLPNGIPEKEFNRIEKELKALLSSDIQLLAGIARKHNIDQQELFYWWQTLTDDFLKKYRGVNTNIKIDGITLEEGIQLLRKLSKTRGKKL